MINCKNKSNKKAPIKNGAFAFPTSKNNFNTEN